MDTKTLKRHAALVDRMAEARGVDLEEEVLRGSLSVDRLTDAVLACTGCAAPGDCERRLAAGAGRLEATPGYCRNADLFDALGARPPT